MKMSGEFSVQEICLNPCNPAHPLLPKWVSNLSTSLYLHSITPRQVFIPSGDRRGSQLRNTATPEGLAEMSADTVRVTTWKVTGGLLLSTSAWWVEARDAARRYRRATQTESASPECQESIAAKPWSAASAFRLVFSPQCLSILHWSQLVPFLEISPWLSE